MLDAEGRRVVEKAREGGQEGKSASTQAGEFVREEITQEKGAPSALAAAGNRNRSFEDA